MNEPIVAIGVKISWLSGRDLIARKGFYRIFTFAGLTWRYEVGDTEQ